MKKLHGFTKSELTAIYRKLKMARQLDQKMLILLKQGKVFFHIGSSGHGAAQVAAGLSMQKKVDWAFPYYRDQALCLELGMTPKEIMLSALAKADDPASGGRQMPQHYGHADLRIPSQSSPTGTQFLQAAGVGMGIKHSKNKEVVYVSAGEGTTSQGDFHEALNWCAREQLPVIFHIQDNHYAISVTVKEQTAGGSIYKVVDGYRNLERFQVDGTNFFESYATFQKAIKRARSGKGPSVVVSDVIRLLPHSASDDDRKYRSPKELEQDRKRDPLLQFQQECIKNKFFTQDEFDELDQQVFEEVDEAAEWALTQPDPDPATALDHVYAPAPEVPVAVPKPRVSQDKVVLVDAINHALHEEMEKNEKMLIYGEDIAGGKGGVFTATRGLTEAFGKDRVFNSPLAESSIVGTAIGASIYGYKPVVEIQFGDYIWPAMNQICNELAALRYRSNGQFKCPVVIRVPVGGYIHGAVYHSQCIDGIFTHFSGLRIAFPSNAADAKGLLKSAIAGDDPVIFMEHKGLYRAAAAAMPEPPDDYYLPFGRANVVQKGSDLTVVAWGMMVKFCLDATRHLPPGTVEVIDPRTLNPLDMDTILQSVQKTGKALIVHEDMLFGGLGGEIAAQITENAFEYLDGPVRRIGAANTHVPYSPALEAQVLPQADQVAQAIQELLEY